MEPMIGEIKLFAGSFEPRGWKFCNGQTLEIFGNEALYAILGNKYGGNFTTTFALPNIAPVLGAETPEGYDDLNYIICVDGLFPSRS